MNKLNFVIGRFQFLHKGHENLLRAAITDLENNDSLLVLIGSADSPITEDNPLSYDERERVVLAVAGRILREQGKVVNVVIMAIFDDLYDDAFWFSQVRSCINQFPQSKVQLFGSMKDDTWYLSKFPEFTYVNVPQTVVVRSGWQDKSMSLDSTTTINATMIRELVYGLDPASINFLVSVKDVIEDYVPAETIDCILDNQKELANAAQQYAFHIAYKKKFKDYPFGAPTFVTTDAFVYCMGHVLMIKRKTLPGKGLWAMPGGFLEVGEHIKDGIVRELQEETNLVVPTSDIENVVVFDHPKRSKRGRIITHCGLIKVRGVRTGPDALPTLPRVRGGDDAERAKWVPLNTITNEMCFEDHASMIKKMGRLL